MNRTDRLHAILTHLQSKKKVRAQEIADRFGISLRTVYRDIRAIDESGVPVIGEAGSGYSIMEGFRLPPVMFTQEEAAALLLAGKLAAQFTDDSVHQHMEAALYKIKAVLRSSDRAHLEALSERVEISKPRIPVQDQARRHLASLQKALVAKQLLLLRYRSLREEGSTQRQVEPIGLFHYSGHWHLIGWCRLRNDYRDFRIDRIESLQLSTETFEGRSHLSLQEYIRQPCHFASPVYEIIVRFHRSMARTLADQKYYFGFLHEEGLAEEIRMHFVAGHLEHFGQWLLSFTDQVRIESPAQLQDIMRELSGRLTLHYGKQESNPLKIKGKNLKKEGLNRRRKGEQISEKIVRAF